MDEIAQKRMRKRMQKRPGRKELDGRKRIDGGREHKEEEENG